MDQATLYTADGLKALKLKLVTTDAESSQNFSPAFVYPLFGENETIFGYRDLSIKLWFASGSLKNLLDITYEGEPLAGDKALDIEATLYEYIPPDYTKSIEVFDEIVAKDETEFKPLGSKIGEYARRLKKPDPASVKGKGKAKADTNGNGSSSKSMWENCEVTDEDAVVFEAYQTRLDTPGFKEYHRRMQIFVLLYIEGGSYIDEEDDRWEFVTLYEKRKNKSTGEFTYHFVGYTSLYEFFHWPDKTRLRLAQFVILPPYQGSGHGSTFYNLVYLYLLQRSDIAELTIEDPSEAFQDMRDKVDYRTLVAAGVFDGIVAPVDPKWRETTRKEWKLGSRQFYRLIEMALRSDLLNALEEPASTKAKGKGQSKDIEKDYRLMVKERLCRFNYEILAPMDQKERKDTLHQTYESVVDEYDRLLDQIAA